MPVLIDMAEWNLKNNTNYCYNRENMYYKNKDAVEKVLRYISRTRWNEDREGELISIGGAGIDIKSSITQIIDDFIKVQKYYEIDKRGGRRIVHLVYSLSDEDMCLLNFNYALVDVIAKSISAYFFDQGFQTFYGIHYSSERKTHIHVALNTVSYLNGKKYHSEYGYIEKLKITFDTYFQIACNMNEKHLCGNKCVTWFWDHVKNY